MNYLPDQQAITHQGAIVMVKILGLSDMLPLLPITHYLLPIPDSRFPIPDSPFPIPHSPDQRTNVAA
ncbi:MULTISPECIES: hypothetical protein [Moorena]|nr:MULTISPECIES: hypothetical protein [Moorena]NEP66836.1 hypothetical protein [Moorena sp. SIO3A5]NEQ09096.1 hypothetical protein [Moorena sp. SIO4E2]NER89888.1 hypothetical protein [Moorena sp. SIO3A2]OLT67061.1 hypothetical protein BI334_20405 [Moorena producens 3L]